MFYETRWPGFRILLESLLEGGPLDVELMRSEGWTI